MTERSDGIESDVNKGNELKAAFPTQSRKMVRRGTEKGYRKGTGQAFAGKDILQRYSTQQESSLIRQY